jgi:site-specific recombinase XerD
VAPSRERTDIHESCACRDDDVIVVERMSGMGEAPRPLDRIRAEIRTRHYSRRTEDAYVHWIRRYIVFHGKRHPRDLGGADVTAFLTWLATEKHVAAATQNQAFSAVLFLYRNVLRQDLGDVERAPHVKRPVRVPVVLSVDEVRRVPKELSGGPRLVASFCMEPVYACRNVSSSV